MNFKRILFVGLGGAGQRHLRLFKERFKDASYFCWRQAKKTPVLNADFSVSIKESIEDRYNITSVETLEDALGLNPDLLVVSCPTAVNYKIIKIAFEKNIPVFVEKPAVASLAEIIDLKKLNKKTNFFVSFQRRYHPMVKKLKEAVSRREFGELVCCTVSVSSFVPSWHPYENHLDLYACKKSLGGGVLRTECHELDIILKLFGNPSDLKAKLENKSEYKLDVEDKASLSLYYPKFYVDISLNFMERIQERKICFYFKDASITCDLLNQVYSIKGKDGSVIDQKFNISNDQLFELQLDFFVENFQNKGKEFLDDVENLYSLIEMAEQKNLELEE